jgi:hypothetical protein
MVAKNNMNHNLTFVLLGLKEITTEMENKLYSSCKNDVTLAKRNGAIYLTFNMSAPTREEAVKSAKSDIVSSGIIAKDKILDIGKLKDRLNSDDIVD